MAAEVVEHKLHRSSTRDEDLPEEVKKELAPFNEYEQKMWDTIHVKLKDKLTSKSTRSMITRFIRGYEQEKPDPEAKTMDMLTEALKWRKDFGTDEILRRPLEKESDFKACWPNGFHGRGKHGHIIYIERMGKVDPSHIVANFQVEQIQQFHVKMVERLMSIKEKFSKETGRALYKHIAIVDMEGFGMSHMGSSFTAPMKAMVHIDQFYYPESLYKLIVVNAPWVFRVLWAMVKPWLHPLTRERVKVGNQYLKEYIDEDQLPRFLEGKCKCAGGECLKVPFKDNDEEWAFANNDAELDSVFVADHLHADTAAADATPAAPADAAQ